MTDDIEESFVCRSFSFYESSNDSHYRWSLQDDGIVIQKAGITSELVPFNMIRKIELVNMPDVDPGGFYNCTLSLNNNIQKKSHYSGQNILWKTPFASQEYSFKAYKLFQEELHARLLPFADQIVFQKNLGGVRLPYFVSLIFLIGLGFYFPNIGNHPAFWLGLLFITGFLFYFNYRRRCLYDPKQPPVGQILLPVLTQTPISYRKLHRLTAINNMIMFTIVFFVLVLMFKVVDIKKVDLKHLLKPEYILRKLFN